MEEREVMSRVEEQINSNAILKNLQEEYDVFDMLDYNEYTVNDKLRKNPFYTEQFRILSVTEKSKLEKLERMLEQRRAEVYQYYRENDVHLKKTEIEKYYIPTDERVKQIIQAIEKQKLRVEFFEALYEAFRTQGWQIKQYLQNLREGI